jgi:hypothetical protein
LAGSNPEACQDRQTKSDDPSEMAHTSLRWFWLKRQEHGMYSLRTRTRLLLRPEGHRATGRATLESFRMRSEPACLPGHLVDFRVSNKCAGSIAREDASGNVRSKGGVGPLCASKGGSGNLQHVSCVPQNGMVSCPDRGARLQPRATPWDPRHGRISPDKGVRGEPFPSIVCLPSFLCPFRASRLRRSDSQGVALGCILPGRCPG